jgi:multidrug efflux pump subunit AcrB
MTRRLLTASRSWLRNKEMSGPGITKEKGIIAWLASNHVAANLLMLMILAFGIVSAFSIRKQTTPDFELNTISVRVPYLGAAPQEVEEGVVIKIEEAIQDVKGIVEINSTASENVGSVTAEVAIGVDINEVLSEVKTRVDAISTFPALTEKPVIYKEEIPIHVVFISLYGEMDEFTRKILAQSIRDELTALPEVNQVQFLGDTPFEISIEVSEHALRQYGLTMTEISDAIKRSSVDLPGGTINASGGDILLRTEGQVYTGAEFAELVLRTYADGTRLTVGDVAVINDGFVERRGFGHYNKQRSATLRVLASGGQNELATAEAVKEFIAKRTDSLPDGVAMEMWVDRSHYLKGRLELMLWNLLQGAILVFLALTLFLRLKVAFWVILGIPVAFFGAIALMPYGPWPVTINMISLFGFILVLGIVVDDAIIIGESIYTKIRSDGHSLDNVIKGTQKVAVPATFGVLTTIAAFMPMLFVDGVVAPFFAAMAVVVVLCLMFSLVESKLILPAHLVHANLPPVDEEKIFSPYNTVAMWRWPAKFLQRFQRRFQHGFMSFIENRYKPWLERAVDNRGVTLVVFASVLIVTFGLVLGPHVRTVLFPEVPGDFVVMNLEMQDGTSAEERNAVVGRLEDAILGVNDAFLAENPDSNKPVNHVGAFTRGDTGGVIFAEIDKDEDRKLQYDDISNMWREAAGDIAGVKTLTFSGGGGLGGGDPISFALTGDNIETLRAAGNELVEKLGEYDGVFDIANSLDAGGKEIRLKIKPEAEALGLTMASLGRQVRQAFYGEEAQRIQRGKDELKVMVRYPQEDRRSVSDLENMRIRTPSGDEVPFSSVAEVEYAQAYSAIRRLDRKRTANVTADIDREKVEPGEVIKDVSENYLPDLLARYPGVGYKLSGASQEEVALIKSLTIASIAALFLIYALIAIPLHSYMQPLIIMSVIPFGIIGAVIGHIIMGRSLSMFSLFGLIALAGVVVNDSLILVDFINKARAEGVRIKDAVIQSGTQRFRAIILTSLTTAAGLMPIMFEKSVQAQFIQPMAISMAFGIIFATVITLFLIPAMYMLLIDWGFGLKRAWLMILGREEDYHALTKPV